MDVPSGARQSTTRQPRRGGRLPRPHDTGQFCKMASMSKSDRPLANLRGAVYTTNGPAVVAALSTQDWRDVLQLAGDGLLAALAQDVEGAVELAGRCAAELRERAWEGDEELADQLESALEVRPAPGLRPLPARLE